MIQISGGKSALWWEQKRQMSGGKSDKLGGGKSDKGKWTTTLFSSTWCTFRYVRFSSTHFGQSLKPSFDFWPVLILSKSYWSSLEIVLARWFCPNVFYRRRPSRKAEMKEKESSRLILLTLTTNTLDSFSSAPGALFFPCTWCTFRCVRFSSTQFGHSVRERKQPIDPPHFDNLLDCRWLQPPLLVQPQMISALARFENNQKNTHNWKITKR